MTKEELIGEIKEAHSELFAFCKSVEDATFYAKRQEGKWSMAQHMGHLLAALRKTSEPYAYPSFVLKWKFGSNNRTERSAIQIEERYRQRLGEIKEKHPDKLADNPFQSNFEPKEEKLKEFQKELDRLLQKINRKSEKSLSQCVIPHPALGKISLREMGLFLIVHTRGHLASMQAL